jgi:hypothetical protein
MGASPAILARMRRSREVEGVQGAKEAKEEALSSEADEDLKASPSQRWMLAG